MGFQDNMEKKQVGKEDEFQKASVIKNNQVNIVYGNDKLDYKSINKKYETGIPTERLTVTTGNIIIYRG